MDMVRRMVAGGYRLQRLVARRGVDLYEIVDDDPEDDELPEDELDDEEMEDEDMDEDEMEEDASLPAGDTGDGRANTMMSPNNSRRASDDDVVEVTHSPKTSTHHGVGSSKEMRTSPNARADELKCAPHFHTPSPVSTPIAGNKPTYSHHSPMLQDGHAYPSHVGKPPSSQIAHAESNQMAERGQRREQVEPGDHVAGKGSQSGGRAAASAHAFGSTPRDPRLSPQFLHAGPSRSTPPDNHTPCGLDRVPRASPASGEESRYHFQSSPMQASCGRGPYKDARESTHRIAEDGRELDVASELQRLLDTVRAKATARGLAFNAGESHRGTVEGGVDLLGALGVLKAKVEAAGSAKDTPHGDAGQGARGRTAEREGHQEKPASKSPPRDADGPAPPSSPQPSSKPNRGFVIRGPLNKGLFTKRANRGTAKENGHLQGRRGQETPGGGRTHPAHGGPRGEHGGSPPRSRVDDDVATGGKRKQLERPHSVITVVLDFDPEEPNTARTKGFPPCDDITEYAEHSLELMTRSCSADGVTYFPSNAERNEGLRLVLRRYYDVSSLDVRMFMKKRDYSTQVCKVWTRFKNDSSSLSRRYILVGLHVKLKGKGVYKVFIAIDYKIKLWRKWGPREYAVPWVTWGAGIALGLERHLSSGLSCWSHAEKDRRPFTSDLFFEACILAYPEWVREAGLVLVPYHIAWILFSVRTVDYGLSNHKSTAMTFDQGPLATEQGVQKTAACVWNAVAMWLKVSRGRWYDKNVGGFRWGKRKLWVNESAFEQFLPSCFPPEADPVGNDEPWMEG
ncbi:unnamed protein product [Closterium sp. NIES-65]|nr:unnamed protein product [Closterium sp. NIES-65]